MTIPTLTFAELREKNVARAESTFNHEPGLKDWTPAEWGNALAGEVGELCNLLKKIRCGERINETELKREIADVQTYLDLLAYRLGFNLDGALVLKFNEVSDKKGAPQHLELREYEEPAPMVPDGALVRVTYADQTVSCFAIVVNETVEYLEGGYDTLKDLFEDGDVVTVVRQPGEIRVNDVVCVASDAPVYRPRDHEELDRTHPAAGRAGKVTGIGADYVSVAGSCVLRAYVKICSVPEMRYV